MDISGRIKERVLSNGLKVICLKKEESPVVSVQLWYKTGSSRERDGIRGISHILEHMMFRGSVNIGPEEHARSINEVGGHCNAFTTEDVTAYINSVPSDYLGLVLDLESERMADLVIDPVILETERNVIIEEYHTYMNNPVTKAFLEFRSSFFSREHPYALSPLGNLEDIKNISRDDCNDYYSKWYTPDNAVLTVVGNFKSSDALFQKIDKKFCHISPNEKIGEENFNSDNSSEFNYKKERQIKKPMKKKVDFDVPMMVAGYTLCPSGDNDAKYLGILQEIISSGETSRLYRSLVKEKSAAVMTGGLNHLMRYSGMGLFFALFTPDIKPAKIKKAFDAEIERVVRDGVDEEELQKIKYSKLTSRAFEMYSAEYICGRLGHSEVVDGSYKKWVNSYDEIKNVRPEDIIGIAGRYFGSDNQNILFLKPQKRKPMLYLAGIMRRIFSGSR